MDDSKSALRAYVDHGGVSQPSEFAIIKANPADCNSANDQSKVVLR